MEKYLPADVIQFAAKGVIVTVLLLILLRALLSMTADDEMSGSISAATNWCMHEDKYSSKGAVVEVGSSTLVCVIDPDDPHGRLHWVRR